MPDTVNEIGEEAFGYCTSLKRIDISACKRIKGHAFIGCTSLTEMTIPNGVISIGEKPFAECSSLKKVTIYSGEISAKVFAGNKYIEEIILGENVTDIAQFAFAGCTALKQLTMPKVNDMQAFINYYFGLETQNYTLNGSGTSKIVPERVNTYVYETNGVKHIFGIPADDTNWYYDGDGIEVGGVYYKYTGRPVAVSSWKDYYQVTINRAYQLPLSWTAEFYHIPNLSLQELTITDQLISTKNDVFKGLTCKIDVKQKYPVKSVSLVGNTEVFLDEFSISNYMLRVEHTDGFVEDILFEEKYLQSDINDFKTEGEKTLSFVYDNVAGESILLLKLHIFENVSMDDALVSYDNMPKSLVVKGAPEGTTITYENNNQIEDGDYVVRATLAKPYYETKVLTATLSIRKEKYSIRYVFNNDEAVNDNPSEYRYGVATSLNIPSSKSGTFVSWYEDENYSRSFKGITETTYGNLILYGKFSTIFTVSGNTITGLTDIGKKFAEIAIPQQINGTTIKNIADSAFKGCTELTTVNWHATACTSAGSYSGSIFTGCSNLKTVSIGGNVKIIPSYAFSDCIGLTSITIPDSVTSIGNSAFSDCTGLTSIIVDDGNTKYHSSGNCLIETTTKTVILGCKTSVIPSDGSVTGIGSYAFSGCSGLTSITIPDSVTDIGDSAFSGCKGLTSITIPDSVTGIGSYAFYGCSELQNIYITDIAAWCNISRLDNLMRYGSSNKNLYLNNELVTSVTIPDGVTSIPDCAFRYCTSLTSITIPGSVTSIGNEAFYYCSGLTSVTIGNGVTSIGSSAFKGCSGLTSVTIGNGVTSIGSYVFSDCRDLTSITIPDSVTNIGSDAFYYCNNLQDIYITDIAAWCNISGLDNLMRYGSSNKNLYLNNELVTSVTIPDGVTSIPDYAFRYCTGLTSIIITDSVTEIGYFAFSGCSGLTSITIPNSVTSIGNYAFENCSGLTSITVPDSVTSIGNYAFRNCSGLTTVNWNATACTNAGSSNYPIFGNCSKLTTINIDDNVTTIPSYAFYNCSGLTSITVPDSVTSIGGYVFYGCSGLTSVTIGNGVTSIGGSAFSGCKALSKFNSENANTIAIPEGVLSIGACAFMNVSGVTHITVADSVTTIGFGAFRGCNSLVSITLPFVGTTETETTGRWTVFGYIFGDTTPENTTMDSSTTIYRTSGTEGLTSQYVYSGSSWFYFSIPQSLRTVTITKQANIPAYAFYNCDLIETINLPSTVESLGNYTFYNCSALNRMNSSNVNTLNMPTGLLTIGSYAFSGCSGLTSIVIPDSVTSIENRAFDDCSGLKTVFYAGTEEQLKAISIGSYNSSLTSATRVYNYDGVERTYSFVTNCDQSADPITAKYLSSLPTLTRDGYHFCGWYDNEAFEGKAVCAPYYSKDKTTLYAKWLTEEEWLASLDGTSFEKAFIAESGKTYDVNVTTGGQIVYFAFTPTTSGSFTIQSIGSGDTYGTLYSASQSSLTTNDDGGDGNNFKITYTMTAGTTYYVAVKFYNSSTTGTFKVSFS